LSILKGYVKCIDIFNERVAKTFAWLTVILMIGMVYSTIMRYLFNKPPLWTYDFVYYCANVMFMMGAAYVLQIKGNVTIDLFFSKFSQKGQAIVDTVLSLILFFPLFIALFYFSMINVPFSWQAGERAVESVIRVPIYPLKTVIPITCVMLILQQIAELIRNGFFIVTGKELRWK